MHPSSGVAHPVAAAFRPRGLDADGAQRPAPCDFSRRQDRAIQLRPVGCAEVASKPRPLKRAATGIGSECLGKPRNASSRPEKVKMKHLIQFVFALFAALVLASPSAAQARPFPGPDLQKTYDRLLAQIEKIPLYDNHAHPGFGDDSDVDAMAAPPGETDFMRTRADNPEFITAAKQMLGYPYSDFSPEHMKWLADKTAAAKAANDT